MRRILGAPSAYWRWTTTGGLWHKIVGFGGAGLITLFAIGAISGGSDNPSEPGGQESSVSEGGGAQAIRPVGAEDTSELTPTPQEAAPTLEAPTPFESSADGDDVGIATSVAGLAVASENHTGYDRDLFGDYDRPALLAANFADWPSCDGYYSLADDQCYTEASDVDVDHIVALGEAWDSGASAWSAAERDEFAGVVENLWLMTDNLNQSKSDQDIAEWIPPNEQAVCVYVEAYVAVKIEWSLSVDQAEKSSLESLAADCNGTEAPTTTPTVVSPAPTLAPTAAPTAVEPTPPPSQYLPGDAYNCGDFATYAEAKAYFDAVPGDPSRLDNDGDGIPCESLPGAP